MLKPKTIGLSLLFWFKNQNNTNSTQKFKIKYGKLDKAQKCLYRPEVVNNLNIEPH